MAISSETLKSLHSYSACDISDVLLKLNVPGAGFLADLTPFSNNSSSQATTENPRRIHVAPASTVLFTSKTDDGSDYPPSNIPSGQHWVDLTVPQSIVVISQPDGQRNAVLGGIMASRMKMLDASGVVVYGRIRDIQELKATDLTIWAKGTSTVGAGAESKPYAINVPVTLSGITISPGDIVFSDTESGVVVIPHSKLNDVIGMLPRIVGDDDKVKEAVSIGMSVQEAFKQYRSGS